MYDLQSMIEAINTGNNKNVHTFTGKLKLRNVRQLSLGLLQHGQ